VADRALDALEAGEAFDFAVGDGVRLVGDAERVRRVESAELGPRLDWGPAALPEGCWVWLPDGARVRADLARVDAALWRTIREGGVDDSAQVYVSLGEKQSDALSVRRRRGGDAFMPHGKSSARKLNELLIERKIGAELRDAIPVFVDGSGAVIWAPGIPPASERLLGPDARLALRLTYQTRLSTFTRLPI
jgi:tRNA(Ile)-lysidine synthase